jgi:probable phosphoglycerate mutase
MWQLVLVRHGETQANTEGRWQGMRQHGVLTPRGRQQIQRVADRLRDEGDRIVALYTSPQARAQQTAEAIGGAIGRHPCVEDSLQEMDFGELDSLTMSEIAEERPDFFAAWQNFEDRDLIWPGGERRRDFWQRVAEGWDRILDRHPEGRVVLVSHGGTLRAGIGYLLEWPPTMLFSYNLHNCSLTRLVHEYGRWRMLTLNDTCHLDHLIE